MLGKERPTERLPGIMAPQPQPWFELVLSHLDEKQQRIILARMMDARVMEQEKMLDLTRMMRDMLKEGRKVD